MNGWREQQYHIPIWATATAAIPWPHVALISVATRCSFLDDGVRHLLFLLRGSVSTLVADADCPWLRTYPSKHQVSILPIRIWHAEWPLLAWWTKPAMRVCVGGRRNRAAQLPPPGPSGSQPLIILDARRLLCRQRAGGRGWGLQGAVPVHRQRRVMSWPHCLHVERSGGVASGGGRAAAGILGGGWRRLHCWLTTTYPFARAQPAPGEGLVKLLP